MSGNKKVCYLTGPITGFADYREQFAKTAANLKTRGYEVINPAALDGEDHPNWIDAMTRDIPLVCKADVVAVMNYWQKSRGGRLEVAVALELGKPIIDADTTVPIQMRLDEFKFTP